MQILVRYCFIYHRKIFTITLTQKVLVESDHHISHTLSYIFDVKTYFSGCLIKNLAPVSDNYDTTCIERFLENLAISVILYTTPKNIFYVRC